MKKRISLLLAALLVLAIALSACSASSKSDTQSYNSSSPMSSASDSYYSDDVSTEVEMDSIMESVGANVKQTSLTEKIIYSADVEIETVNFDTSVQMVYDMLDKYSAFLESSNISGNSYYSQTYNYQTYRYASFVVRVPVESYGAMTDSMETLGNVLNTYTYTDNITEQYYDSQSRLDAYKIEQERLLSMLEKAETVTDMLDIESRLSDVRYEIESLESMLRNWQNQVDYSTVSINLSEVERLSETVETHRTYWQEIWDGLKSTLRSIGDFFKGLLKFIIVALPVIVILAICVAAVILIIRCTRRKKRASDDKATENNPVADDEDHKEQ